MSYSPLNIIQISDTHLYGDKKRSLLGVDTNESFHAVLKLLKDEPEKIDFILHTGDLSQDGSETSYLHLAEELEAFHVPIYCLPGNHDNVRVMAKVYPHHQLSMHKHIVLKNWHFILLNSQVPGEVYGHLDKAQLDYLEHCLQAYPEHEAVIAFHHQPIPTGCEWLDQSQLDNAETFWEILKNYPKANTVLFGHVHQTHDLFVNHVKVISAPSTCFQFKLNHQKFALDPVNPGYRLLQLDANGKLKTSVRRTLDYIGEFDVHAKGY